MTRFSKNEMNKASKKIVESIKAGKGLPRIVEMKEMDKSKTIRVDKSHYNGLFEAQNVFIRGHGRLPNYVTMNSTANNPLVMDYQDNGLTCGPTSLSMAIQMLYGWKTEKECAKACRTGSSGTSPDNLIAGAKSLGYTVTKIKRNFAGVKQALNKGYPVIAHIETGGKTKPKCLGYVNNYGHYILIYGTTASGGYKVADPTKGIKVCSASELDKATNGRSIHYYSVKPK